jgi:hypothetical protein|tara:strand:- start:896 stop:1057 length:162 start_codon:yes stop_codon:yes gene_type:complete
MGLKQRKPSKNVRVSSDFDSWLNENTGGKRSKIDLTKMLADVLMGKKRGGKLI